MRFSGPFPLSSPHTPSIFHFAASNPLLIFPVFRDGIILLLRHLLQGGFLLSVPSALESVFIFVHKSDFFLNFFFWTILLALLPQRRHITWSM